MRLGLVGRGPQAQRYLMPKNGGAHIVSQVPGHIGPAEYQDWLEGVDGVIIATHPNGHRWLALDALYAGKAVLCEKPLCLNLDDCEEVLDAAAANGSFDVAHTHLWSAHFRPRKDPGVARAAYHADDRSYSPWLDWGPHLLAMMAHSYPYASAADLLKRVEIAKVPEVEPRGVFASGYDWSYDSLPKQERKTPMWLMVESFARGLTHSTHFNRRVYRALFAKENHATA